MELIDNDIPLPHVSLQKHQETNNFAKLTIFAQIQK